MIYDIPPLLALGLDTPLKSMDTVPEPTSPKYANDILHARLSSIESAVRLRCVIIRSFFHLCIMQDMGVVYLARFGRHAPAYLCCRLSVARQRVRTCRPRPPHLHLRLLFGRYFIQQSYPSPVFRITGVALSLSLSIRG